jgi:hypothetical protein
MIQTFYVRRLIKCGILGYLILLISCAGTTKYQGLPEVKLKRTPYYAGITPALSGDVGHFPILLDHTLEFAEFPDSILAILDSSLNLMNDYLDNLKISWPLYPIRLPIDDEPLVYIGNVANPGYPGEQYMAEWQAENQNAFMGLFTDKPSLAWCDSLREISRIDTISYFLFITLGVSEYLPRKQNILGFREVEMGTGYTIPLGIFIGGDDPVPVIHLTGALLDSNGNILRAGAEGIIARPHSIGNIFEDIKHVVSGDFSESLLRKENLMELIDERRTDLQDLPYAWQVALQNLVDQLLTTGSQ